MEYRTLVTTEDNKSYINSIENRDISNLPDNDTLIKVKFSSLNYKDGLSFYADIGNCKNIFTNEAIIIPNNPIIRNEPSLVKSLLVVYP